MGGRLKIYHSQVQRQPVTAGVKADPDAFRTGDAAATLAQFNAAGNALKDFSEVGAKIAHAEQLTRYSGLTSQREELFNRAVQSIETENDTTKHEKIVNDFYNKSKSLSGDLKGAFQKQWEMETNQRMPYFNAHLSYALRRKRLEILSMDNESNWKLAVQNNDEFSLAKIAESNVSAGLWTETVAQNNLADANRKIGTNRIAGVFTNAVASGRMTTDQALELLGKEGIDIPDKDGQIKSYDLDDETRQRLTQHVLYWEKRRAELLDRQREEKDEEFLIKYQKGQLLPSEVETALQSRQIARDRAEHYFELLTKKAPEKTDPVVRANLNDRIQEVKAGLSDANSVRGEIDAARASGKLTDEHYFSLRDDLKTQRAGYIQTAITEAKKYGQSQILSQGLMGFSGEPVQYEKLNDFNKALDDWIIEQQKGNKPISAEDIYRQSRSLVPFYRMSPAKLADEMAKDVNRQEQMEKEFQSAPAGLETVWQEMSLQERKDAKTLLGRGVTAQQIKEALTHGK